MAGTQQVSDDFLDEVDDSFLDEPAPDPNFSVTVKDNEPSRWESLLGRVASAGLGAAHGTAAGWADEGAGVLGAAAEKLAGSDKPFGDLYREGRDYARKFYDAERAKDPTMFGAGDFMGNVVTGIAATPLLPGGVAATGAKALARQGFIQGAAQGLGNSTADNALGMAGDAAGGAIIGAAGGAVAPTIARGVGGAVNAIRHPVQAAKSAAGALATAPRRGLDKLYAMLGGSADNVAAPVASRADDFAEQMAMQADAAPVPDNVVPMRPQTNAADVDTKITPKWKQLLRDEYGGSGKFGDAANPPGMNVGKMSKTDFDKMWADARAKASADKLAAMKASPEMRELAEMLGQNVDEAASPLVRNEAGMKSPFAKPRMPRSDASPREPGRTFDTNVKEWFDDQTKPTGGVDDLFGLDPPQHWAAAEQVTNPRAKSPDMYQPMGVAPEAIPVRDTNMTSKPQWLEQSQQWGDNVPLTPEKFDEIAASVNQQGAAHNGGWSQSERYLREAKRKELASRFDANDIPTFDGDTRVTEAPWMPTPRAPLKPQQPIEVPGWQSWPQPPPSAPRQNLTAGKQQAEKLAGVAGAIYGSATGGPVGAYAGYKGGGAAARTFDKFADKAAVFGQKLLSDPAKLQQLEMQGGQIGKAAGWIMDGFREGGESAATARAYVVSSQPWWREQLAEPEESNQ